MGGLQNIMKQMQQAGGPGGMGGMGDMAGLAEAMKYENLFCFCFQIWLTVVPLLLFVGAWAAWGLCFCSLTWVLCCANVVGYRGMMGKGAGKKK
jgi:hypothetical protein